MTDCEREKKMLRRRREIEMQREREKERDVSASTPTSVTDDGVDAETSLSFSLSAFLSLFSAFTLCSRPHNRSSFSLKMRVSSKELFSTLKIRDNQHNDVYGERGEIIASLSHFPDFYTKQVLKV